MDVHVAVPAGQIANQAPFLAFLNTIAVDEGSSVILTSDQLHANDPDDNASHVFYVVTGAPLHGVIRVRGAAANQFTQADLDAGVVTYAHDGSETTMDTFHFTLRDALGGTAAGGEATIFIRRPTTRPTRTQAAPTSSRPRDIFSRRKRILRSGLDVIVLSLGYQWRRCFRRCRRYQSDARLV
ncbi:MAG: cadherin-like domain-containing protein [Planctomycetota bacterium]